MKLLRSSALRTLLIVLLLLTSIAGTVSAQGDAPPTAAATDTPPETAVPPTPTDTETPVPSVVPTDVPPTALPIVTDNPPAEVATEVPTNVIVATEVPTDVVIATTAATEASIATEAATELATVSPTAEVPATAAPTEAAEAATDELLITYRSGATEEEIAALLQSINGIELERIPQINTLRVKVPKTLAAPATASAAIRGNAVSAAAAGTVVELNGEYTIDTTPFTPNDALFGQQTNLTSIYATTAWGMNVARGTGITIAIVDTGVNASHPDLAPNMLAGYDFVDDDANAADLNGHGTHVAGIAAAKGNNLFGISGVAPNAKIMPVRVMDATGNGNWMDLAQGIIYAADKGARVINLSLGGYSYSSTVDAAVQYAVSKGVVVVAAAGNGDNHGSAGYDMTVNPHYPASLSSVISVGNVDGNNVRAYSSNYGKIDVVAPGESILSSCLTIGFTDEFGQPCNAASPYFRIGGTSMATPEIAGVAALILSAKVAADPYQVREALICGAANLGNSAEYGAGLVQADWSMNWRSNSSSSCKITLPNNDVRTPTLIGSIFPYTSMIAIDGRNATREANDPYSTCNPLPQQSVWYQFKPITSGPFVFSTLGSSFDTTLSVYKGDPGSLVEVGCNDDALGPQSMVTVAATAGQTYYVMVATFNADPDNPSTAYDSILNFSVAPGILTTAAKVENSAPNMLYSGTWQPITLAGQSGTVSRTSDNDASVTFNIRSWNIAIGRTTGPDRGSMDVYIDGVLSDTIYNRTALPTFQSQYFLNTGGNLATRTVTIKRSSAYAGPIDLDWIQGLGPVMTPISGQVDDRDARVLYYSQGSPWVKFAWLGAYLNTSSSNNDSSSHADFKFTGSAFTINHALANSPGYANLWVDGNWQGQINTYSPDGNIYPSVPYSVAGLSNSEHIVIVGVASTTFALDSIKVSTPTDLATNVETDERNANLLYTGLWSDVAMPIGLTFSNTLRTTIDPSASIQFTFTGTTLDVKVGVGPDGGIFDLYIDGNYYFEVDTYNPFPAYQWHAATGVLTLAKHNVTLVPVLAPGQKLYIDSFRASTYPTLKAAQGVVAETNPAFIYSSAPTPYVWTTKLWARFQGGTGKTTSVSGSEVDFYINGTGALIYTDVAPDRGSFSVEVDGNPYETYDLFDGRSQRPAAIGVVNLGPGIHKIILTANVSVGQNVTFDGVRVFP